MTFQPTPAPADNARWLISYYFLRAGVSALWVTAAFTVGKALPGIGAALLIAYPAWDALANYVDAIRSGGLKRNMSQMLNLAVSLLTTIAVAVVLGRGMNAVIGVFGGWAILSGLLQLFTGIRRWKTGAQWAMVLSGAQSALAGGYFLKRACDPAIPAITDIAGYAGVGAVYFLISGIWLSVVAVRATKKRTA